MSTATAAAVAAIAFCDWKGCGKPATHKYRWDWGEEGKTCPECVTLINQAADNLSRKVQLSTLEQQQEAPLTRSERTGLIAAKLSAESELEEVQTRGHELYKQNVDLTKQVQTHTMRAREHEGQLTARDNQIERLSTRLAQRESELAEATLELQRLRVLVPFTEPTERSRLGLQPAQQVSGQQRDNPEG